MINITIKKPFKFKISLLTVCLFFTQLAFSKPAGVITFSLGEVTITHADKSINPVVKNTEINAGDIIETRDGRVQLALIDGGKVSLQPNSIYKINKYEFSGNEDGSEYGFTELIKGGLRTISGLIGHKNRERYQLKTAVATIGIRGTEFTVNYNNSKLLMTTNNGSVDVCNSAGCLNAISGQTIEVVGFGNAPQRSQKAANVTAAPSAPAPAAIKAVFASSDAIDSNGIPVNVVLSLAAANASRTTPTTPTTPTTIPTTPVIPVIPVISNGLGTAAFIAVNVGASTVVNDIYNANLTFNASGNLTKVDNISPIINITTPLSFGSFKDNDGIVAWGQSNNGNFKAGSNNFAVGQSDYIAGAAPNPVNLANLTGTYNVFASTAPSLVSGGIISSIGSVNSVTGSFSFNFTAGINNYSYNLIVPTLIGNFNLTGSAVGLNVSNPSFESAGVPTSIVGCVAGCTGALNAGKLIQGAFYGVNGERVGLQYGINTGLTGAIYGGAVLK